MNHILKSFQSQKTKNNVFITSDYPVTHKSLCWFQGTGFLTGTEEQVAVG